jgi:UDPglucose 6-dehydrogenase
MKIVIVGSGYVGQLVRVFPEVGIDVTCVDIDRNKIDNLNKGIIPIYEPGEEMITRNMKRGLSLQLTLQRP